MQYFASLAAVAAFLPALVSAHVSMNYPDSVYTHHDGTDLNPLNPDGSNYPCFYTDGGSGTFPTLALGSQSRIGLQGSAVHGGGSCQISITYDVPPNPHSTFKVIKSFQGDCPIHADGNLPADPTHPLPGLQYNLPSTIPGGKAVVAWTWFNKIGNREMYMRCAPVTLTGGSKDSTQYDALPDMFKANIGNGCSTTEGVDLTFPDPGSDVVGTGNGPPVGNCGGGSSFVKPPVQSPVASPPPTPTTTVDETQDAPTETTTAEVTPTESDYYQHKPQHYADPSPTPVSTTAPVPTGSSDGACEDGKIYCTTSTTWSICDHGKLVAMGNVADGTQCRDGYMVIKRDIRFSSAHARRRAVPIF